MRIRCKILGAKKAAHEGAGVNIGHCHQQVQYLQCPRLQVLHGKAEQLQLIIGYAERRLKNKNRNVELCNKKGRFASGAIRG
jgi:hypothetical protein